MKGSCWNILEYVVAGVVWSQLFDRITDFGRWW